MEIQVKKKENATTTRHVKSISAYCLNYYTNKLEKGKEKEKRVEEDEIKIKNENENISNVLFAPKKSIHYSTIKLSPLNLSKKIVDTDSMRDLASDSSKSHSQFYLVKEIILLNAHYNLRYLINENDGIEKVSRKLRRNSINVVEHERKILTDLHQLHKELTAEESYNFIGFKREFKLENKEKLKTRLSGRTFTTTASTNKLSKQASSKSNSIWNPIFTNLSSSKIKSLKEIEDNEEKEEEIILKFQTGNLLNLKSSTSLSYSKLKQNSKKTNSIFSILERNYHRRRQEKEENESKLN